MNMLTKTQKEDLRHAVLEAIATRHPAALSPRQLAKPIKRDLDFLFEEEDIAAALEILRGLELAEYTNDALGTTQYWRATSKGVIAFERS